MKKQYKTYAEFAKNFSLILCNNIPEIDNSIYDNIETWSLYQPEEWYEDEIKYIYQYYLMNASSRDIEYVNEHYPDVIIAYSDLLDVYVLLVDHFWTAWNGIATEFLP